MDGRKRHKRGRMMRGEGGSLVLILVLFLFWRRDVEKEEGDQTWIWRVLVNLGTLHLVGLGLGGLGNLWRFPGLGNHS